ncbi:MAG: DUF1553 domain-containing protein [Gemmataceae bacterium]
MHTIFNTWRLLSWLTVGGVLFLVQSMSAMAAEEDGATFFATQVQPILQAHCLSCHGGEERVKGGLNLSSRAGLLEGGDGGPVVTLDKPHASRLLQAVRYQDLKMPPRGKLPQAQLDILTRWVEMGVPWSARTATQKLGAPVVDDHARQFWSFRPVQRPPLPAVKNAGWVKNPIDAFLLAKLEAAGLEPAPPAAPHALLRRLYYDLIGLPPTSEEVRAFEQAARDDFPAAYEAVVDRLLASPHYGERWGRHWLDLVRYAETNSFERDGAKPHVWRYRDYVIRSFNEDKPYDRFIMEQLAGDELDNVTVDAIIATGYYRLPLWDDEPADPPLAVYDELDDIVSTTGQVFLGLTVGCARCHDHKIDPFPQEDYYRLLAFFRGIRRYGVRSHETVVQASVKEVPLSADAPLAPEALALHRDQIKNLDNQLAQIDNTIRSKLIGGEKDDYQYEQNRLAILQRHVGKLIDNKTLARYQTLWAERERLRNTPPANVIPVLCVKEMGPKPPDTFVLKRGNPGAHGAKVTPGFPSVLTTLSADEPRPTASTSGRRRVLAEWLASPDNPLTARVLVNRLWQYHFGRGIVRSSSNFGYQGTPPTHPELLDWLASEFVASGWKLKRMHKLMVMSNAYRMSSRMNADAFAVDPENDRCWRFDPRRLTAEEIRDTILAVSGNLNRKMFGPSIYPVIPPEVLAGQSRPGAGWGKSSPEEAARRSVYIHIKRSLPVPILASFDAADPDATCPVRFTTTQAAQALGLLNSDFTNEQARLFAQDVHKHVGDDDAAQVCLILWRVTQRAPTTLEIDRGTRLLHRMRNEHKQSPEEALRSFCLLALNLNEFVYVD